MTCGRDYLHSAGKTSGGVCMLSHQTELVEVGKEPPGVDVSQAVPHLQVGQRGRKHLEGSGRGCRQSERKGRERVIRPLL